MQLGNRPGNRLADQIANLFDVDERVREEKKMSERISDYTRKITECKQQGKYCEAERLEQERNHVERIHNLYNKE